MARSHAKILCSVWRDPDGLALSPASKLLYVLLLSQPRLTLLGTLDVAVGRWANLAGMTRDRCEEALGELEATRYVVVDTTTDELLVRTFTHHDLDPNRLNVNLCKGLWGQWASLQSPVLRSLSLHEMPEAVWAKLEAEAPADAVQTRRSARLEPHVRTAQSNGTSQLPPSSLLPPVTYHPPAESVPVRIDPEQVTRLRSVREANFGPPRAVSAPQDEEGA